MVELIRSKVPSTTARDMLCYSRRYTAKDALRVGIIDYILPNYDLNMTTTFITVIIVIVWLLMIGC